MTAGAPYPPQFDDVYFSHLGWSDRLAAWRQRSEEHGFSSGNAEVVEETLSRDETGLRVVVNISADALLSFLSDRQYRNLYETPHVGGDIQGVSETREEVDHKLQLGPDTYFGALALGGTGVRYYGEYCLVIRLDSVPEQTTLFDRDSYDIVIEPFSRLSLNPDQIRVLSGSWTDDRVSMVAMKVLPELIHDRRLVTAGTISDAVLRDQEFVEVHMPTSFGPDDLEEVRLAPDEVTVAERLESKRRAGRPLSSVDEEWLRRRGLVDEALDLHEIRARVVTMHGKGYQWR